ncbi:MAG: fumarylacetoacetate hydrolase family protein [Ignavibacteria bacterium]|nr:fumarylacetoacetate hydrolase family protein [Ignavibacteria bacterium]MBT8391727.1 fumarylacetoacetate hydrolase family protein [Ignavibacteria bacterium]NNL21310.1 fumarylacetoacetate hydrolase family protein [Ignavibacteriaceae bacterium]
MKLVSYTTKKKARTGIIIEGKIYDLKECAAGLGLNIPRRMRRLLRGGKEMLGNVNKVQEAIKEGKITSFVDDENSKLLAPIPNPPSCRDGYAFRQHVATARRNRGVEMIPEFDQYSVFYFTNHNAIFGEGEIRVESDHLQKLDFELEAAIVIGKEGRNISAAEADEFIAGYTIMNDLSARLLQMEEMKLNLGPAKGKDFATSIGPWLVTPDELEQNKISTDFGNKYDLRMTAKHNGKLISDGNMKDMNWTFAEIIERASYGVRLFPGDVIGSGTVGTGCYLELNGTWALEAKEKGEEFTPIWLQDGDTIELEISGLGVLKNSIVKRKKDRSILEKKKNV